MNWVPPPWSGMSEWPTESEAAAMLQTSVKSIQRYAAKGLIEIRKRPRPGRKPENICNPRDVEKLLPTAHVVIDAASQGALVPKPQVGDVAAVMTIIRAIATAIGTVSESVQNRGPKLWLSLDEAAEYSGLSRADLLKLCQTADQRPDDAQIIARKSGGWKIQRKSLEEFEG